MQKKIVAIGNSQGVILDKTLLGLIGADGEGATVELRVEGGELIISASSKAQRRLRVRAAADRIFKDHAASMAKLAK